MIVCVCHRVSDRDIARAAREGCASFEELQFELGVATACGRCSDCARETLDHHCARVNVGFAGLAQGADSTHRRAVPIKPSLLRDTALAASSSD
jgi:bacterioferritin-associated ferredoxin